MVVRRLRKTLKRSLSIAMAAALMVTSVPELSVTAAEQEAVSEQDIPEETAPAETEEGAPQDGSTAEGISTEITSAEQKEDTAETQESSTEQHETKSVSETESASDTQSMTEWEDSIESETETAQQTETETETEEETTESEAEEPEEPATPANEEVFYEENFNDITDIASLVNMEGSTLPKDASGNVLASVEELSTGNKAIKIPVDLSKTTEWTDIFKVQIDLPSEYAKTISEKVVMSYDLYFPVGSVDSDFGKMTAMPGLKSGKDWTWVTVKNGRNYATENWAETDIEGYKVFHVEVDMNEFTTWDGEKNVDYAFADITPVKSVIPCLAGNTSKYKGDIYLDNLKVKAVGVTADDGIQENLTTRKTPTTPARRRSRLKENWFISRTLMNCQVLKMF